jgi:hypothetical protein
MRVRFRGNVFTEPLLRNGRLFIRLLHSNDCTHYLFRGLYLAMGLYATILPRFRGDYRRGMDWWMDLLTTCTHHSELQVITALSLISTLYKWLAHAKYSQFAFTSRFLITDLNNEVSPASVLTSLLSGKYPATKLTQPAWGPRYVASRWTQEKTPPPNSFSIVVMGDCLATARISLTCLPAATKQRMFLLAIVA